MVLTSFGKKREATKVEISNPAKEPGTFGKKRGVMMITRKEIMAVNAL